LRIHKNKLALVANSTKKIIPMKKLIAVVTLFLAFAFSANAQTDKRFANAAKADAVKMSEKLNLTPQQEEAFINLFAKKYELMEDSAADEAKMKQITEIMNAKIRATLTPDQNATLDNNPVLLAELTGTNELKQVKAKK
jgi:hypothetical protein